jgi:WD40 repeat protein
VVRLWNIHSGQEVRTLPGVAYAIAFSPDGRRLASVGGNVLRTGEPGVLTVWDVEQGKKVFERTAHSRFVFGVAFSPDGRLIASMSADPRANQAGEVKIWEAADGKELASYSSPGGYLHTVDFSPDGKRLALAGLDDTVRIVEPLSGQITHSFRGASGLIAVFSPDGRQVAAGAADGTLFVWDADSGRRQHTIQTRAGNIAGLVYSKDGSRLAAASLNITKGRGEVKLYELTTGREILSLPGQMSVHFSPDGYRLAAPGQSHDLLSPGVVQIWDATPLPGR